MRKSAETSETADQSLKITQTIHTPFWIGLSKGFLQIEIWFPNTIQYHGT